MSIVVAGAAGTLGRALVARLGVGKVEGLDFRADEPLEARADVLGSADVVINVGGPRVRPGLASEDYLREHVGVASRLVRAMRPGSHLVHVSSTAVYGARRTVLGAATPEAPTRFPMPIYAAAKLAAETYVRAWCREHGRALTVLRPSMVYGPGIDSALETLRLRARRGLGLDLRPAGLRQHLVHIDLLVAAVEATFRHPEGLGILVLADPFVLTNRDLRPPGRAVPIPLDFARSAQRAWARHLGPGPGGLDALAVLALDNEFEWRPAFEALGLPPERFGRACGFEPYWGTP